MFSLMSYFKGDGNIMFLGTVLSSVVIREMMDQGCKAKVAASTYSYVRKYIYGQDVLYGNDDTMLGHCLLYSILLLSFKCKIT